MANEDEKSVVDVMAMSWEGRMVLFTNFQNHLR
jgi:hypothetical protein